MSGYHLRRVGSSRPHLPYQAPPVPPLVMSAFQFELPADKAAKLASRHENLKKEGMIRVQMIVPIWYNNLIKAEARSMGKNADAHLGELHMKHCSSVIDQSMQQEAQRLREQYGPQWLEMFAKTQACSPTHP